MTSIGPNEDPELLDAAALAIVALLERPLSPEEEFGLADALARTPALHAELAIADLLLQARAERQIESGEVDAWTHLQTQLQARTEHLRRARNPDLAAWWALRPPGLPGALALLVTLLLLLGWFLGHRAG